MNYYNLHVHTENSTLDGVGNSKEYAKKAKELGQKYCAITDHGTTSGTLKFQQECLKQGITPLVGAELYIVPDIKTKDKSQHIAILCKNEIGWIELNKAITFSNLKGFYKKPRIGFEQILNADMSGWIILTGCLGGFLNLKTGQTFLKQLYERIPEQLYLEIMPHTQKIQTDYNELILKLYNEYNGKIPLVATNDTHYVNRNDYLAQEALLCIQRKDKWSNPNRFKFSIKNLHLKSETEMTNGFIRQGQFTKEQIQEAMSNTVKIAKQCENSRIPKQEINLPDAPGTEGKDADAILFRLCHENLNKLFKDVPKEYSDRLDKEFKLISSKKFSQYFLIFHDIINYCKENDIMTGPGRGSAAGCLISYLLGITKIDPIFFDLSFARFISEDRNDLPDIDVDFAHNKRDQIVKYITETYGKNHVCGISTDSRLKSKSILWDIGRVFEIPREDISRITKVVNPKDHEKILQDCFDNDSTGKWFSNKYPEPAKLAVKLENQLRHHGQHPAAVVICKDDLTQGKYGSLRLQNKNIVSSWDMQDSEYNGLIKLDILALSTLTILDDCVKAINDKNFNLDKILLNDEKVFKMLSDGNNSGVFQFSERPSVELCKEMKINNFNDMIAVNALVRPGPYQSGQTATYIKRKHGTKWIKLHQIYEEITKDTYGIIVYQEQVMKVIHKVAGLPESTADKIRKVIGKKRDVKEFEPYRIQFLEGCKKQNTLSEQEANEFWEGLKEHASYSFNKSHSTAYALLGYQTAYCKVHYPKEFLCACLSHDSKQSLIDDAQNLGLKIMLPKVDISDAEKWIIKNDILYAPFTEIGQIGIKEAKEHYKTKIQKNVGFFTLKSVPNTKSKIGMILKEIGAYKPDMEPNKKILEKHFSFSLKEAI